MAKKKKKQRQLNFNDILKELNISSDKREALDTQKNCQYFLIVSEGEKTEPNYFKALSEQLPQELINLTIVGEGKNTISVIDAAIRLRDEREEESDFPFDEVWAVFDKDDFPDQRFNAAVEKGEQEDIKTAYSNEAFELWYVLHFQYLDVAINRKQYIDILKQKLGDYIKNDTQIYDKLQEHEDSSESDAIQYAEKLYKTLNQNTPAKDKPITKVYQLVSRLNEFKF